jgi:hypothetical protein
MSKWSKDELHRIAEAASAAEPARKKFRRDKSLKISSYSFGLIGSSVPGCSGRLMIVFYEKEGQARGGVDITTVYKQVWISAK